MILSIEGVFIYPNDKIDNALNPKTIYGLVLYNDNWIFSWIFESDILIEELLYDY